MGDCFLLFKLTLLLNIEIENKTLIVHVEIISQKRS